ncbi:hypothetical protein HCX48_09380 [Rhodocyclus tenuis]|uniref:Uncharacterized protein n=1 Tax=Rhodocyclus gracilis TaxID=2929842 RepID=A0ABX0WKY3_9RHOO|nr:hypothetical protein [Rhodocyclus gracilis]NJA89431.1 hypothetical protein [Rhodocyclus gracilis]
MKVFLIVYSQSLQDGRFCFAFLRYFRALKRFAGAYIANIRPLWQGPFFEECRMSVNRHPSRAAPSVAGLAAVPRADASSLSPRGLAPGLTQEAVAWTR